MKTQRSLTTLSINLALVLRIQAASTVQFAQSAPYVVAENAGSVLLSVERLEESSTTVSVDFAMVDGTAIAGLKYIAVAGTLTFAPGETNKTIVVSILNDGIVGGNQDFQVILINPSGEAVLGTRAAATVRVLDNDKGLQFEFSSYSVAEDAGTVLIGVLRRDDGKFPVTVDYATADGAAKSGVDYTGETNTLSFAVGETVKLLTIPILNDAVKEPNKSFRVTLSNPTGGGVLGTPKTATVTVLDNDPGVQFEFSNSWVSEDEGSLTLNVLRGRDADAEPFTVDYATTSATALASQDYIETRGTLTFAVGERSHQITVPVLRNESSTADRQFQVRLSNPSTGAGLGTNRTSTVTVLDTTGMRLHRISGISVQLDHSVRLSFEGGVHKRFKDYFDLYPLEVSNDLVTWIPWTTLERTNASTNGLTYAMPAQAGSDRMFFRTAAGPLITPHRQPSGPFAVGAITRLVTDPSRRNRYGISTNGSFVVTVWHPAVTEAGRLQAPLDYPFEHDNSGRLDSSHPHALLRSFVTHTFANAAWPAAPSRFPVILYSHGLTRFGSQRLEMGPNLASHGYVVVVMDHFDSEVTVFPDGSVLHGPPSSDPVAIATEAGVTDRVSDLDLVLDLLGRWNSGDSALEGRLDLETIGAIGFSWGGAAAAEFARVNQVIKAVVLLDPTWTAANRLIQLGLSKPFVGMRSTELGEDSLLYDHPAATTAIWFMLRSSLHAQFSDYNWVYVPGDIKGNREISGTINDWALWFLNKYVKGLDEPMPALKDYPRITGFKQK